MDHGFNDRVVKVFGSISSSSSSTPWSLTDAQLERNRHNRDDDDDVDDDVDGVGGGGGGGDGCGGDQIPVFSSFRKFQFQTESLDEDGLPNENDWDIRSSIGLDSTLDNEEEEDAYDKMAEGREDCGDRLYMKGVTDHGPYLNSHNVLPRSIHEVKKDPRANHDAAKTRLKEDDDASYEPMLNAEASEDGVIKIKSILKRKSYNEVSKPAKRVRFHPTCKNVDAANLEGFDLSENGRGVPDYILNPSNYTRYTFDDCSHYVNDGSNSEEFLEQIKESSKHDVDVEQKSCGELPKSVVFVPRKKRDDTGCKNEEHVKPSACSTIGIAALEVQGEVSEMQEDDQLNVDDICTKARCQKPIRQYRSKMEEYDDVS